MAQGGSARSVQLRHFYLPNEVAWDNLMDLQERYAKGIVGIHTNRHAWESILRVYFPQRRSNSAIEVVDFDFSKIQLQPGQTAQTIKYSVVGHPLDQGPPETDHGVGGSASVRRIITDLPSRTTRKRDMLYVKCSPANANEYAEYQWNGAMRAAVASLRETYTARAIYFILGVGMEWLPFYWDPDSPAPADQALKMAASEAEGEGDGAEGWYEVAPEVRSPPGINAGHIDAEGVVHTDRARSLDCFTVAPPRETGDMPMLAFQADLDFLEEFLGVVERHAYVGENEPESE